MNSYCWRKWNKHDKWISLIHMGGVCGVMVIVAGNGHGDMSSNPGWDWLHFS